MQKIRYPLIVSDFDGTLLRGDGTISAKTRAAIEKFQQAGGRFAVCTGRTVDSILPRVKELGLKGLVACFQGSVIVDIESGSLIVDGAIPNDEAARICRFLEELGAHIHVYALDEYYSNKENELLRTYERISGVKAKLVTDMPLSQYILTQKIAVRKVLVLVQPEAREEIYQAMLARLGEEFYVTYSASFLVEVSDKAYSKASAVRCIAEHYGLPVEQTVAVGDCLNDKPMIEAAGVGIAVKNAEEELKRYADVVCPFSNDEDAIACIIEEFGYTKE